MVEARNKADRTRRGEGHGVGWGDLELPHASAGMDAFGGWKRPSVSPTPAPLRQCMLSSSCMSGSSPILTCILGAPRKRRCHVYTQHISLMPKLTNTRTIRKQDLQLSVERLNVLSPATYASDRRSHYFMHATTTYPI